MLVDDHDRECWMIHSFALGYDPIDDALSLDETEQLLFDQGHADHLFPAVDTPAASENRGGQYARVG